MLLTKLTRYVRTQSGSARITVAFLVHVHQIAAQGLVLRLFVKIVSLSFRSFLSFQLAGQWKNMLNESFTQHMDAIKSCSTKQQFSIKVYLRDILHPYLFLNFLASTCTSLLRSSTFHLVAQMRFFMLNQITKMFVKCFFIRWFTDRGHRGNLSNWHHFLCSFCSTYDLVTEINLSPIKRKLLFRYAEKKYNNT